MSGVVLRLYSNHLTKVKPWLDIIQPGVEAAVQSQGPLPGCSTAYATKANTGRRCTTTARC